MASSLNNGTLSALEDIIKKEATSRIMSLDPDVVVDTILQREDPQSIQEKLFSQLDRTMILSFIKANDDSRGIYVDMFKELLTMIDQTQQSQPESTTESSSTSTPANIPTPTQTHMVTAQVPPQDPLMRHHTPRALGMSRLVRPVNSESSETTTPTISAQHSSTFESGDRHNPGCITVDIRFTKPYSCVWAPTFMSKDEFFRSKLKVRKMKPMKEWGQDAETLYKFIKLLNPPFLCHRVERLAKTLEGGPMITFPETNTTKEVVKSWNAAKKAGSGHHAFYIVMAFVAVQCYKKYEEKELVDSDVGTTTRDKWYNIIENGWYLSSLTNDFGGEPFLALFPLRELYLCMGKSVDDPEGMSCVWAAVRSLLEKTDLGEFFCSLSKAVGSSLLSSLRGSGVSQETIIKQLTPIFKEYSLDGISSYSRRLVMVKHHLTPETTPLSYCGQPNQIRQLSPGSRLAPSSLLQLVAGKLEEDIIQHLILQRLPDDWLILGEAELSEPANESMLLHDFGGIVVPLCVDDGWCLLCYVNPTRFKASYPITFVDSTGSEHRLRAAVALLSTWIPSDEDWIPKDIAAREVKVLESQASCDLDIGIHVVLNACAMAKTQKPETRPLDKIICKALRVEFFVTMLNEMHLAVAKASRKGKQGT
ncbi:uncharacterized protein F4822DRAFT_429324 [Hypoxylon trugodes]|uniref:uncharacterized protein n=1 Tax=Hypoxylon trugodes TaxID=326681 RepID=UPI00218E7BEB|nr:uncharacterized protein F4822DRAFT_429324 [Hypoxylon trugodes]KAI1388707.1 hypothetical protein F4822DRAFT_429324 [Hypoxylon trugodes]